MVGSLLIRKSFWSFGRICNVYMMWKNNYLPILYFCFLTEPVWKPMVYIFYQ